jgi:hypothetical protein
MLAVSWVGNSSDDALGAMLFATIDWNQPWLARLRHIGEALAASDDWIKAAGVLSTERRLSNASGHPIRFIAQQSLPASIGYESHIAATGEVPTRNNLHDFFNTLAWLHFPSTKCALNTLQAEAINHSHSRETRGPQRDAATLFDENAAIFVSYDANLLEALRAHDWRETLQKTPNAFFSQAEVILFGHALIEKLIKPYKSITAHVWTMKIDSAWFAISHQEQQATLDQHLALMLLEGFDNSAFCHLPVLGVPGWWHEQDAEFYADTEVFRPKRQHR